MESNNIETKKRKGKKSEVINTESTDGGSVTNSASSKGEKSVSVGKKPKKRKNNEVSKFEDGEEQIQQEEKKKTKKGAKKSNDSNNASKEEKKPAAKVKTFLIQRKRKVKKINQKI
jgi:hypothetical protein